MERKYNMVRFFTYSQFHGKYDPVGSDYLRVHQLIKYWDEAELYKYGENPDVLIFTKVFIAQDYKWPKHFQGIKILDICDPMWFEDANIVETVREMDAVTCSTEALAEFIRQFHRKVIVIPDRFDLEVIPAPKKHLMHAKTVTWFGYRHNAELLRPALKLIEELNLNLIVIANDNPVELQGNTYREHELYRYLKYQESTIYDNLLKADFAVLPDGNRPEDQFKSNNKTIKANLVGLPVAKTADEVRLYLDQEERKAWFENSYDIIQSEYDIRKSVEQYKEIIDEIKASRG